MQTLEGLLLESSFHWDRKPLSSLQDAMLVVTCVRLHVPRNSLSVSLPHLNRASTY